MEHPEPWTLTFSEALRTRLHELGMTQADLARHLGTSTAKISQWANSKKPDPSMYPQLLEWFDCNFHDLAVMLAMTDSLNAAHTAETRGVARNERVIALGRLVAAQQPVSGVSRTDWQLMPGSDLVGFLDHVAGDLPA